MSRTPDPPSLVNHPASPTIKNALRPPHRFFVDTTCYLLASEAFCQFDSHAVIDDVTGQSLYYRHLIRGTNDDVCSHSMANYLGRLA